MSSAAVVDRLAPGDHVCWAFDDDAERLDAMARFVEAGLRGGERVLYLTDSPTPAAVEASLAARGVEVDRAVARGQARLRSAQDGYLPAGSFDAVAVVDRLASEIEAADHEGYAGLRVIGDMAWAARVPTRDAGHADRLARYEEHVNRLFLDRRVTAVCQYDRRLFAPRELRGVAVAHPATAAPGDRADWSPMLRMRRGDGDVALRLVGQVDTSNWRALAAVLDDTITGATTDPARAGYPVVVDVSALTFADVVGARTLVVAGRAAPHGLCLRGCQPPVRRVLGLVGARTVPGMVVEAARC